MKTITGKAVAALLIIAPCREEDRFQVTRDLNREILLLFEKEKIRLL